MNALLTLSRHFYSTVCRHYPLRKQFSVALLDPLPVILWCSNCCNTGIHHLLLPRNVTDSKANNQQTFYSFTCLKIYLYIRTLGT